MTHNPATLKENPIQRKILHAGTGNVPDYQNGDRVTFHYKTVKPDISEWGNVAEGQEGGGAGGVDLLSDGRYSTVLDDSKRPGHKPMQLILGKQFKLIVWEQCVKCMRVGECSAFLCATHYCIPYPIISKTLRNVTAGVPAEQSGHCCGQQLMAHGVGYDDLNALMKDPQPLIFILEVVQYEAVGTYDKEHWYMSEGERGERAAELRERGNRLYREGSLGDAADTYREALAHLESLSLREKPGETEWVEIEERKVPLLLNYAQCLLKLGDYYPCIQHTTTVIDKHADNMKALFRRGCAYVQVFEPENAERDLNKVKSLASCDPATSKACDKQLALLRQERLKKNAEDVKMFGGKLLN